MRRPFLSRSLAIALTAAALLLGSLSIAGSVSAATNVVSTTTCANGMDNTGGLGLICQVTVVNTITASGGTSRTTVRECHGAAGDPTASCRTTVWNMSRPVTNVTQCNDSINGGGGTLRCSVKVTNNFVGRATGATAATVNQCVGSGDGIANTCSPFAASTTSATITQCNGSANGGTLVQLKCTASGTKPSSNGVRINQCNGSANGGGALVICSASIANNRVSAAAAASAGTGSNPTAPPTDLAVVPAAPPPAIDPLALAGIVLLLLALATIVATSRPSGSSSVGRRLLRARRQRDRLPDPAAVLHARMLGDRGVSAGGAAG